MQAKPPRRPAAATAGRPPRRSSLASLAPLLLALLLVLPGPPPRAEAVAAAVGGGTPPAVQAGDPGETGYVFGVFPYLPPLSLDRIFAPIVGALSRDIGRPVHLRTKPSFEAFAAELTVGSYDLAFMHPFLYVATAAGHGYVPLARVDEPLRMVFLANVEDGDLTSLRDLGGRTLALPGPLAAVSEMAKLALAEIGLRPGVDVEVQHYQTKMSCVQALAIRNAAACGLPSFVLAQLDLGARDRFRVFDERSVPVGLVVVVNPRRVGAVERRRLAAALVAWSASPEGRAVMSAEGWPGFAVAEEHEFGPIREIVARSHRLALQR